MLLALDRTQEAEQQLIAAQRHNPLDMESRLALGDLFLARGEEQRAVAEYRGACAIDVARSGPAQARLGEAYRRMGQLKEALISLRIAVRIDPLQVHSFLTMVRIHLELGHPDQALEAARAALRIDETFPEARGLYEEAEAAAKDAGGK